MKSPLSLTGIGLRPVHYGEVLEKRPALAWLEVHSENYFGDGGTQLQNLAKIREHYPISLHGVSMSLGSSDELNWQHLKKLRELIQTINPCLVSDHLSWSSIEGQYLHDLLPLPYTEEALQHVITRIQQVQDYLGRQILIENVTHYVNYAASTLSEPEFINEVANRSGCGILLDINNVYVNSVNLHFDPQQYLSVINPKHIQELHLAGFSITTINEKEVLVDTHNKLVVPAVWDLFRVAVSLFGIQPTIIEWDKDIPSLETLCLEAFRAEKIMREQHVTQLTA